MTEADRPPAEGSASRRNGALSKGPRTTAGKAASARNAVKHGLFRSHALAPQELSPAIATLAATLADQASGRGDAARLIETIMVAALRLEQATSIVRSLRTDLDQMFARGDMEDARMALVLGQLVRMGRYERRFRGQRDRALRALITPPTVSPAR
jgi:hypothetical protein